MGKPAGAEKHSTWRPEEYQIEPSGRGQPIPRQPVDGAPLAYGKFNRLLHAGKVRREKQRAARLPFPPDPVQQNWLTKT